LDIIYPLSGYRIFKNPGFHPGITCFLKFCDQQGLAKLREAIENEELKALKKATWSYDSIKFYPALGKIGNIFWTVYTDKKWGNKIA